MPDWKTHLIFSLILVICWMFLLQCFEFKLDFGRLLSVFILSIFASLFPDIDIKSSKIRDIFSLSISLTILIFYVVFYPDTWYYGPIYFILLYLILKYIPTKHRGITHSFGFAFIFSIVLTCVYISIIGRFNAMSELEQAIWFFIIFSSYSLHLVLDRT